MHKNGYGELDEPTGKPEMRSKPNFLFLFPDQWRHTYLGSHEAGVPVRTPNLDSLAAQGIRFTECRTNSPLCAPARACLALGLRRRQTGVEGNHHDTDPNRTTIFNRLREHGYWVSTCGKNDLHKGSNDYHDSGWADRLASYGFDAAIDHRGKVNVYKAATRRPRGGCPYIHYLEERGLLDEFIADYTRRRETHDQGMNKAAWPGPFEREDFTDDFCGRSALKLLRRAPSDQPWCLWVNFPGPHGPQDAPAALFNRYRRIDLPPVFRGEEGLDHANLRRLYAASCEGIDDWCGRIIEMVAERGQRDETIIVFASDHGEMLGDHGRWGKSVWREHSVRVPLIAAGPGIVRSSVSSALVELIDVGATLLDYAGAKAMPQQEAYSLRPLLEGESTQHRDYQISDLGDWQLVSNGRFKFVSDAEGEHLFDLEEDSQETADQIGRPEFETITRELRGLLSAEFS